jgi:ATP-binding cassette subfamily B protein
MSDGPSDHGWLRRNLRYCYRNGMWRASAAAVAAALVSAAATVAGPLIARSLIDALVGTPGRAGAVALVLLLIAVAVVRGVAGYLRRRYASVVSLRIDYELRRAMFAANLRCGESALAGLDAGQLVTRSTSDLALVEEMWALLPMMIMQGMMLLLAVGIMFALAPLLTAVALLAVPAVLVIARRGQRMVFPAMWAAQDHLGKLTGIAQECVYGIGVVMGFGQEQSAQAGFDAKARALYAARMRLARIASRYMAAMQSVPPLGQLVVLAFGGWLAMRGQISPGTFVAFAAYLTGIVTTARAYSSAVVAVQQAKASVLRIFQVLDTEPAITERPGAHAPGQFHGAVQLTAVTFGYDSALPVLDDVSLCIAPGETVALLGPSGSGKSTLALLLARFHDPDRGSVRVGGYDVRDLRLAALRAQVGLAFDDAFLFSGTIRENIAYGRMDASLAQVREAAMAAAADSFIRALPDGYDTVIGERGLTLSGGQRQRIALARTLLLEPAVLVLDDATSAVDPVVEAQILAALTRRTPRPATLLITHRPSALRTADRICVLDGGRVVDVGTDRELRQRCPAYTSLVRDTDADVVDSAARAVGMLTRSGDGAPSQLVRRSAVEIALSSPPGTAAVLDGVAALPDAADVPHGELSKRDDRLSLRALVAAHRWLLLAAAVLVAADSAAGLAQPVLMRRAIDAAVVDGSAVALLGVVAVASGVLAAGWLGLTAQTRLTWRAAEEVMYSLRTRTFGRLLRLGMGYYEREPAGRALSRITVDAAAVSNLAETGLVTIAVGTVSMAGMLIVLIVLDASLVRPLLAVLAAVVVVTLVLRARSQLLYGIARDQASQLAAQQQENLNGLRVVQALDRGELNVAGYARLADSYRRNRFRALMQGAASFAITEFLSTIAAAIVVGLGSSAVAAGSISLGTLVAFLLYVDMLFAPIQQISGSFDSYQQASIGLRRLRELDDLPVATPAPPDPVPVGALTGLLQVSGVRFRYPDTQQDAFRSADLRLRPGETVALVGETGSGKSTLLKLIARFYDVAEGTIRADSTDIRRFRPEEYRKRIGIVPQEPFLFTGTVLANIAYGRPGATYDEVRTVTAAIGVDDVLSALPDGYHTQVGPQGRELSAGQRQLVALARAHLVEPRLLLLDEATAALDLDNEAAYQRAAAELRSGRTTLMIAHRLSTARRADRILVLRHGQIVESGRHDELVAAGGEYARLWAAYQPAGQRGNEVPA